IFSAVVFNLPGQTKSTRSKAVKNVRQHACSILVKICKEYQDLVFPVFDELFNHIQSISNDPDNLSQMERCILMEAMILISNNFNNFEKQSAFIEEVLKPVKEFWSSEEFRMAFWSTDKFMSYVGLDQAPVEPSSADTCGINRSHISFCIHTILAVIKRSKWPVDFKAAKDGGFVNVNQNDFIMRNPATAHITCLLENVLALLKAMNMLFCENYMKLCHPDYRKAYLLPDNEILSLLGVPMPHVDDSSRIRSKQPLERMQNFLTISYEISFHILGNAGQCLGSEFYAIPNLAESMIQTVLSNLEVLPDYRLRPIIRVFLKPFINNCPSEYYRVAVLPVLAHVCPFMYLRLGKKWKDINERCQTRKDTDDDNQESQEVIEEQVTRQLTREYVELLGIIFYKKRNKESNGAGGDKMCDDDEFQSPNRPDLGELGNLCLSIDWERKTNTNPERGFTDDGESVPEAKRRTAAQKVIYLELMLGQIANFCPIISRNTIVKNATSIKTIWQTIRLHFGFQSTGAHFLDFDSIQLQPGERPEDLYQRLSSFIEDNTLKKDGGLSHMGTVPDEDEEITPTVENLVVLTWLRLIDNRLPALVKQRYGTELRSRTLATLKPEISLALDSLLDEIHAVADAKVMRSAFKGSKDNGKFRSISRATLRVPYEDKRYLSSVRQTVSDETAGDPEIDQESYEDDNQQSQCYGIHSATSRRVSTKQSPTLKTFYKHFPLNVTLDTGAEINMLKLSVAHYMGVPIKKSNQRALQADGSTPLKVAGETHIVLTRGEQSLTVEALVVEKLRCGFTWWNTFHGNK
ncbi:exportin-5-like, partial [Ruditapes philippinarum]|uniref:exportin-5-like n=1 Tax=Ruditapes philippinarum TaxID=129788 RepID=UPI00295AEA5E